VGNEALQDFRRVESRPKTLLTTHRRAPKSIPPNGKAITARTP
jgi:hypothetical protein